MLSKYSIEEVSSKIEDREDFLDILRWREALTEALASTR